MPFSTHSTNYISVCCVLCSPLRSAAHHRPIGDESRLYRSCPMRFRGGIDTTRLCITPGSNGRNAPCPRDGSFCRSSCGRLASWVRMKSLVPCPNTLLWIWNLLRRMPKEAGGADALSAAPRRRFKPRASSRASKRSLRFLIKSDPPAPLFCSAPTCGRSSAGFVCITLARPTKTLARFLSVLLGAQPQQGCTTYR